MDEPVQDSVEESKVKPKSRKLIIYVLSVMPIMMMSGVFLVTKFINPRFAEGGLTNEVATSTGYPSKEQINRKDSYLYEFGTVLVNPSGTEGRRFMRIGVSLELKSKSLAKNVDKLKPKLQHQLIMILSAKSVDVVSSPEGKSALQEEIRNAFASELGLTFDELYQVYFSDFVIQ